MSDPNDAEPKDGFWTCNIDTKGRWLRLLTGLACLGGAAWLWIARDEAFWASGLIAAGLVAVFEGVRGWCVVRAFGFKTPL